MGGAVWDRSEDILISRATLVALSQNDSLIDM
jgi:hypothetical protein